MRDFIVKLISLNDGMFAFLAIGLLAGISITWLFLTEYYQPIAEENKQMKALLGRDINQPFDK
jgi:hypothetical protein